VNAGQAAVDACERVTILATGVTRRVSDMTAAGVPVQTVELVDAARLEGRAAALSHALALLARPYARHPELHGGNRPAPAVCARVLQRSCDERTLRP
jgi:hypothetical protein